MTKNQFLEWLEKELAPYYGGEAHIDDIKDITFWKIVVYWQQVLKEQV